MGSYKPKESHNNLRRVNMSFNLHDLPPKLVALNPWIKGKIVDLANNHPDQSQDKNLLFEESSIEAKKWFESASEEEKEDILKRYPTDLEIKD